MTKTANTTNDVIDLTTATATSVAQVTKQADKLIGDIVKANGKTESNAKEIAFKLAELRKSNAHLILSAKKNTSFEKFAIEKLAERGVDYSRSSCSNLSRYGEYIDHRKNGYYSVFADTDGRDFGMSNLGVLIQGFGNKSHDIIPELLSNNVITYAMSRGDLIKACNTLPDWVGSKPKSLTADNNTDNTDTTNSTNSVDSNVKTITPQEITELLAKLVADGDLTERGKDLLTVFLGASND